MVIYPGTLSGGLTEDDMSQLKEVQGKGSGNLENDTEKRSEQRQLILRERIGRTVLRGWQRKRPLGIERNRT